MKIDEKEEEIRIIPRHTNSTSSDSTDYLTQTHLYLRSSSLGSSSTSLCSAIWTVPPSEIKLSHPGWYEVAHYYEWWNELGRCWKRTNWSCFVPHPVDGYWREWREKIPVHHYMESRKFHIIGKNIFEGTPRHLKKRCNHRVNPQIKQIPTKKALWRWQ